MSGKKGKKTTKTPKPSSMAPPASPPKKTPVQTPKPKVPRPAIPASALARIRPAPAMAGFYDPVSSTNEVRYKITDYFDLGDGETANYYQYLFDQSTVFLGNSGAQGAALNLVRVDSVKVFALPAFSLETASSAELVAFSLPVSIGGEGKATCQRTTLLTPTSVSNWVLVGAWSAAKVFKDALYTPAFNSTGLQAIASLAVLSCDELSVSPARIQCRIEYTVSSTLPLVTSVKGTVPSSSVQLWDNAADATAGTLPVLVQVLGMSDIA